MSYVEWTPGCAGEGFLVREGHSEDFKVALYRSDEIHNTIHFILFVAQRHASGNVGSLFAAIGSDSMGRFMLRTNASEKMSPWRLAREVAKQDPRLTWAGPGDLAPMANGLV